MFSVGDSELVEDKSVRHLENVMKAGVGDEKHLFSLALVGAPMTKGKLKRENINLFNKRFT